MEFMWESLVLFMLYYIFANVFLKPVVVYSGFRMQTLHALQASLEGMGIIGVSCFLSSVTLPCTLSLRIL